MAATKDRLLQAIEAVHTAGLDEDSWPRALGAATGLLGANCATLETLDPASLEHLGFLGFNIPPADQLLYLQDYVPLSPRTRFAAGQRQGTPIWDYQVLSERGMDRDPFYAGFLRQVDLRYYLGGIIANDGQEMTAVTFHRSRKQGHADRGEIAIINRILPHFRQAYEMTARLREARSRASALQAALDWLADGVALLAADGTVLYANEALHAILRRNDGIRLARRALAFATPAAAARLAVALGEAARFRAGDTKANTLHDFAAARAASAPPYLLSLRPILKSDAARLRQHGSVAVLFVHDPQLDDRSAQHGLVEALGLTEAESRLAQALQQGISVTDYARERGLSQNTAYTHLRRVKEKTGCKRMGELIRWLNDLRLPLRRER